MSSQWKPYLNEHELRWKDWLLDLWVDGKKYREHLKRTIDLYLGKKQYFHAKAKENLTKWQRDTPDSVAKNNLISLTTQDSLAAAREHTRRTGVQHTVVNFANAVNVLGVGRYRVGSQEEAMARQTNLSVTIKDEDIEDEFHYTVAMSKRIKATYFNPEELVMITEADGAPTPADQVFSFKELRCAADDLRVKIFGIPLPFLSYRYNDDSMRNKIRAQLDNLVANNITHVILGAFGCGAFKNPPEKIAKIYRDLLVQDNYLKHFKNIVFAIKGNGKDRNFKAFATIFTPKNTLERFINEIEDTKYWQEKVKQFPGLHARVPTGIKAMQDYVHSNKEASPESKLKPLQQIAQARLNSNPYGFFSKRTHETTEFYHEILRLSV